MDDHRQASSSEEHPAERLAQGEFTAVDRCECGSLQLHVGALTLRMSPRALAELADTLNHALLSHCGKKQDSAEPRALAIGPQRRGEA